MSADQTGNRGGSAEPPVAVMALALDTLPAPVLLVRPPSRIVHANRAARALFGEPPEDGLLSSYIRAPALGEAVAEVARSQRPVESEFTSRRAREERELSARLAPVADHVVVLIEDRTTARRVERMRRDFVANASHELRTPLAAIAGFIETLQGPAAEDAEARRRFLGVMAREAERMARLIEDLMALGRIEMTEHLRPETPVDLPGILVEVVSALAPIAEEAGVGLHLDPKAGRGELRGDAEELRRLFVNLIENAIRHGGSGGRVEIVPAGPDPAHPRMIGVTVRDFGPGIARHHVPRLTERFYRVPSPVGAPSEGTGLGLSIVKHILARHRGDLTIRSAPGEGAAFTAWLPGASESAVSPEISSSGKSGK